MSYDKETLPHKAKLRQLQKVRCYFMGHRFGHVIMVPRSRPVYVPLWDEAGVISYIELSTPEYAYRKCARCGYSEAADLIRMQVK